MRILPSGINNTTSTQRLSTPSETEELGASAVKPVEMQSSLLQPGIDQLNTMPDVDQAKVDALRSALARGEISFDANRIASLIERYHTGR